jgi:hypothetical protein
MNSYPKPLCAATITIVVAPAGQGRFDAWDGGTLLVAGSHQPFLDTARALVSGGTDPDTTLIMRHAGSTTDALRSRIGDAARLTVDENRGAFRRSRGDGGVAAATPMRSPAHPLPAPTHGGRS